MKLKEKFDSIDQSKLNADQKDFLSKIEKATKNFTSDNKEVNDKVEGALDKMIATFKEKMPEAIKTKAEKKEPKATAKKTSTKATAKPSQTSNPKRTVMSVAKEIRKDGESWADAQKRARAEMKKDKDSATKEVKTEMNKLLAFIKTRRELDGISGTDLKRDSVREAKPRGRRISKDGNVYYENRENRIDRLSPNYPKDAPMLAGGGDVGKKLYYERMNVGKAKYTVNYHDGVKTHKDGSAFYDIAIFKNKKDLQDFISKLSKEGYKERSSFYAKGGMLSPRERYILEIQGLTNLRVGAIETYIYDNNLNEDEILNIVIGLGRKQIRATDMVTAVVGKPNNSESKKIISFAKSKDALKMELGGTVVTDLAGHTGGGDGALNANMPLSGITGTQYSGLVGETGAMSSGEMFENGGGVDDDDDDDTYRDFYRGQGGIKFKTVEEAKEFIKLGKPFVRKQLREGNMALVFNGKDYFIGEKVKYNENDDEYREGGALKNDRRHVNYSQDYEVRYSKNNPNKKRHGYGNLKYYDGGEFQTNVYANGGGIEKMRTLSFKSKEIAEKNRKELVDYFGDRILNSSISKGIDERGNDGFYVEYDLIKQKYSNGGSLENHGIKEGDTFVKTISGGIQKVKDKDGKIVFINLATGERDSQPPLPFNEGGKVPEFIVNKDGIRVSKMVEPKKKLTEKEWMAKYSESKEARAYENGGDLETNIKSRLAKNFNLPLEVAVYVPSTKDADESISEDEFEDRVESVQKYLSNLFGGFSSNDVDGGYMSQEKGLITEEVYKVISFAQKENFGAKMEKLVGQVKVWAKDWGQESIGLEFEGDLFYIDQKGNYAEGGDIEAFSMRMVKGSSASPTEVITEEKEVKFVKGGSLRKKRNDYLSKLSDKEADIWDKIGANSGTKIRGDKKMLKAYAEGVEEMLTEENVQGRSFDQEDYDFYTDQNSHLFNDFLVWNGYYKPEMTVVEKKWREKAFKEGNIYVSDPEVIFVKGVSSSEKKSKNYILNSDIKFITVNKKGMKYTFKGSDVLNGANILEKGNVLETKAIYIPKRDVISVELKDGSQVKPSNGYWIKKDASGEIFKTETEKAEKGGEIEDVLKNAKNASKKHGYDYYVYSDKKGEISLARKSEFERLFDKDDLKIIYKVDGDKATKLVAKAEKGAVVKKKAGNPKMKEAMVLAKKIRKDGEKWTDAVKRAYAQVK